MTTIFLVVVVGLAIFNVITPVFASDSIQNHDARKKVLEWLSEDPEFHFNNKLSLSDGRIVAKETIEEDEVLMVIPATKILSTDDEGKVAPLCLLYATLVNEIDLGADSEFAPYLQQTQQEQATDILLPSLWSNTAQRLLIIVSLTRPDYDIVSLIDDHSHCIGYASHQGEDIRFEKHQSKFKDTFENLNQVLTLSPREKTDRLILALAIQHQIDQKYFVPLYDQIPHHHLIYNVQHTIQNDGSMQVVALRTVQAGQQLSRQTRACLQNCQTNEQTVAIDAFAKYGVVQPYPHFWKLGNGVSFLYNGSAATKSVTWITPPNQTRQIQIMQQELQSQRHHYKKEVLLSKDNIDPREWEQIDRYCRSLMGALKDAIQQGKEYLKALGTGSDEDADESCSIENSADPDEEEDDDDDDDDEFPASKRERMYEEMDWTKDLGKLSASKPPREEAGDPWLVKGCGTSERCTMVHIAISRGCASYEYSSRRNETEWATMRSAYIATVGPRRASIKLSYGSGFKVPIIIGHSPGRGRGVFSTGNISKGTLIWQSYFTATFSEGYHYRRFLSVLPNDLVCDLLSWCYTFLDEGEQTIACDLDEASLFNHADHSFEYNIGEIADEGKKDKNSKKEDVDSVFALRDIEAGEELVTTYDEFHSFGFDELGLM